MSCNKLIVIQVAAVNDERLRNLMSSVFGDDGLAACNGEITYDVALKRIQSSVLEHLHPQLQQYFEARLEPLLRKNMMAGCPKWTNNACESINHVLKQRLQWRVHKLPELIEQLRRLIDRQEADRAIIGRGDLALHPDYARHRITFEVWRIKSLKQRNRARDCFRLPSTSDGTTTR